MKDRDPKEIWSDFIRKSSIAINTEQVAFTWFFDKRARLLPLKDYAPMSIQFAEMFKRKLNNVTYR